jgi:hypothetical protein
MIGRPVGYRVVDHTPYLKQTREGGEDNGIHLIYQAPVLDSGRSYQVIHTLRANAARVPHELIDIVLKVRQISQKLSATT